MVTVVIDGKTHQFPKGTNLLEACLAAGTEVPYSATTRACRRRAVAASAWSTSRDSPKPVPSCYTPVADKMEVATRSPRALDVRRQMLEFTLVNHPIDCPICDKAGECMLQKHYFDWDAQVRAQRRHQGQEGQGRRPGPHIVLDQERCILCTRCIRVCDEVGEPTSWRWRSAGTARC